MRATVGRAPVTRATAGSRLAALLRGGQDSGTGQPAARELRVVTDEERRSRDGHDDLCAVVLESMAMDSDKHARLLELAARAQRAGRSHVEPRPASMWSGARDTSH